MKDFLMGLGTWVIKDSKSCFLNLQRLIRKSTYTSVALQRMSSTERKMPMIKYDKKDVLSKGRFGAVFRGTYQEKEEEEPIPVAIKSRKHTPNMKRKLKEGGYDDVIKLNHVNVVKLYDVEDKDKENCR